MKTMLTKILSVILAVMMVIPAAAASADCPNCGKYCAFSVSYEQWTANQHAVRGWCSSCGKDIYQGTNAEPHSMSNGVCSKCGYNDGTGSGGGDTGGGEDAVCTHPGTAYSWEGCTWYEYCTTCYVNLNTGVSHSTYTYSAWSYYNSSRHYRTYACSSCGEGSYEYGYHSTTQEYSQYSSTQHKVGSYCATCATYIGSTSYESHNFTYGPWTKSSGSQHRRSATCSDCGYSTYEYAGHSLSYGSWSSTGSSQHKRTVSCACGYSTTEIADHNLVYGAWTKYSDTRHKRTVSCSDCSYSTTEYADHSLSYSDWESYDELEHYRDASCSGCGYSTVEYADHTLTAGDWKEYSDTEHSRTTLCSCGYMVTEFAEHEDTDNDGFCDGCGYLMSRFSVTVPAVMLIVLAEDGSVYTAANAAITNNSTASVMVTKVTITAGSGWTIVPYHTEMADEKVDSRLIGFLLNDAFTSDTGYSENLSLASNWTVTRGNSMDLLYDAVVSATSEIITEEQVLTIVFVLDWARD